MKPSIASAATNLGTAGKEPFEVAEQRALEEYRNELIRIRIQLAELKRTGSRDGISELSSAASVLSMRIARFETSRKISADN